MTAKTHGRTATLTAALFGALLAPLFGTLIALFVGAIAADGAAGAEPLRTSDTLRVARPPRIPTVGGLVAKTPSYLPDLVIQSYAFSPINDKRMRVKIANVGSGIADISTLKLTVRRIDGTPVGRTLDVSVGSLQPGHSLLVPVDAKSILPNAVALSATTFRLDADADQGLMENNENNNRLWHNL